MYIGNLQLNSSQQHDQHLLLSSWLGPNISVAWGREICLCQYTIMP